ncbi:AAA family ATPase [Corynebacterium glucuronolyticum]
MTHQFIHACAGSGKTQHIVDHCSEGATQNVQRLIITLTTSGQDELEQRLGKATNPLAATPEVTGWYLFLLNHIVRPYLPLLFRKHRVTGFIFDAGDARARLRRIPKSNARRYLSENDMAYKDYLEELAAELMIKAGGLVENRLALIYDEIIIDEAQDISRSGLDVIELLLRQDRFHCLLVGDSRQSLIDSSLSSRKNKKADRENLLEWYRRFSREHRLKIIEKSETYRFNQSIADFSDTIFPKTLGFSPTVSRMKEETPHDGVFLVAQEDLEQYFKTYGPTVLRASKASWRDREELTPINFGISKGRTFHRVMILATKSIEDFCLKGKGLTSKSACGFYVAVTRARYSVAIVVQKTRKKLIETAPPELTIWMP